jgi:hypothetical protein
MSYARRSKTQSGDVRRSRREVCVAASRRVRGRRCILGGILPAAPRFA